MTNIYFEDGPLGGKTLTNTTLAKKFFLTSKNGEHLYYYRRTVSGTIPGTTKVIELQWVYAHVKEAEWKLST